MSADQDHQEIIVEAAPEGQEAQPHLILRPALRSMWFMIPGLLLGPAVIYFERDPQGHPAMWVGLTLVFVGLALHRLSLKYIFSGNTLKAESWWGLGREESLTISKIESVGVLEGFVGRLVGCGHLEIKTLAANETFMVIMGQANPAETAARIEALAAEMRNEAGRG